MWDNTPEEIPPGTGAVLTVPEFGDYGDLMPSANTSELAYAYDPNSLKNVGPQSCRVI